MVDGFSDDGRHRRFGDVDGGCEHGVDFPVDDGDVHRGRRDGHGVGDSGGGDAGAERLGESAVLVACGGWRVDIGDGDDESVVVVGFGL